MSKITITKRSTIIGDEYTATYGPIQAIAPSQQSAISALVEKLEWVNKNWITGKVTQVVEDYDK
jgi:hypothetical protein